MANKGKQETKYTSITTTVITVAGTIIVALIGVLTVWIQKLPNNPIETNTPTLSFAELTPTIGQSKIYTEDFTSGTSKWWPVENLDNDYAVEVRSVRNNVYRWEIVDKKSVMAAVFSKTLPITSDFELSLELRQMSDHKNIPYGVIFRYGDDGGYQYAINGHGQVMFAKSLKIEQKYAYLKQWSDMPAINLQDYNTLKIVAQSSRIQLYVNGELVGDFVDESLKSGQIMLMAIVEPGQTATIEMRNFSLIVLSPTD